MAKKTEFVVTASFVIVLETTDLKEARDLAEKKLDELFDGSAGIKHIEPNELPEGKGVE